MFRPPFTCFFTDMQLTSNFLSRRELTLPSPKNTRRPRRPESLVSLSPEERLAARARTAAHVQQSSDAWSQLHVKSPVALQVTTSTPAIVHQDGSLEDGNLEDGNLEDDNVEHDLEDDLEDDLEAHRSSGSEKLDSEDPGPTPDSQITIDMRIQMT